MTFTIFFSTMTDIDECTIGTDDCGEYSECDNIDGGFTCTCPSGFVNATDGSKSCLGKSAIEDQHISTISVLLDFV